jgi:AcrR family transcriptional regulator
MAVKNVGLTQERIVEAAIAVIDEHGVAGCSMRRLGGELGVDAMAVYWHFPNKAAVLDAVVEHEARRMQSFEGRLPADPLEILVAFGVHMRRVLLEHPNLAPLVASRPLSQDELPATLVAGAAVMRAAGFADADIPLATEAMGNVGLGYVLQEAGLEQRRRELGLSFRKHQAGVKARLVEMSGDTSLEQAMVDHRLDERARDETFERSFRALLHGLRLGLGRPPA